MCLQIAWRSGSNACLHQKKNQWVILAERDQRLCGFVCAYGNDDPEWGTLIDNLHVRIDKKRLGIGKRLMAEVAKWSIQNYPDAGLYLSVLAPNTPARRFYESLGAQNQSSSLWEPPGGGEVVDLRYVWADIHTLLNAI